MNPKQTPATHRARAADSESARVETSPTTGTEDSAEARWRRTAIAAFYRAEARGFTPGRELEDWLEAEREVAALEARASEIAQSHSAAAANDRSQPDDRTTLPRKRAGSKRTRTTKTTQGASLQARNRGEVS